MYVPISALFPKQSTVTGLYRFKSCWGYRVMNNTVILQEWGNSDGWSLHLTVQDKNEFLVQWLKSLTYKPRDQELLWQKQSNLTTQVAVKGNTVKKLKELKNQKNILGLRVFDKQDLDDLLTTKKQHNLANKFENYSVAT